MNNLKKDYPDLFKIKETIVEPKKRNRIRIHDNIPIVRNCGSHYEVRKTKDSSPIILSKDYVL